jgi:hypothetical protein
VRAGVAGLRVLVRRSPPACAKPMRLQLFMGWVAGSPRGTFFQGRELVRELVHSFKTGDGLNTITRRAEMDTALPVFGLRPILWRFFRTMKQPKEESLTASPRPRQSVISFRTSLTSTADSVRDRPTFL